MDRRDPESGIFIPECVPPEEGGTSEDGKVLYRREQCHKATKYCWCVEQETGIPIPGISTYNVMPDCDKAKIFKGTHGRGPTSSLLDLHGFLCRFSCVDVLDSVCMPMNSHMNMVSGSSFNTGCPHLQKKSFLQELLDQLSTQMVEHAMNNSGRR